VRIAKFIAAISCSVVVQATCVAAGIDSSKIDAALKSMVESKGLVGVSALIYAEGRESYFGAFGQADREAHRPMSRDTVVQIFSMTKPIAGVAFMQMYEQGKFNLDDPLEKYLPEFAHMRVYGGIDADGQVIYQPVQRSITIRDITRHTTGMYNGTDHSPLAEIVHAAEPTARTNTLEQESKKLASLPLLYQPGTRWLYGPSVDLQALLVERLSGMPFDRYLEEHIFKPLRMRHTHYVLTAEDHKNLAAIYEWHPDGTMTRMPDEQAFAFNSKDWPAKPGSYGLVSTVDDYMRFARMLLNGGELDGARILKADTVKLMATDAMPAGVKDTSWLPTKGSVGFGIDFAVRTKPPADAAEASGSVGEFFWDGAADTLFWVDPKHQICAVLFTQYMPFGKLPLHKAFRDAVYSAYPDALAH
jgi:CubicO group peptidase (beta-lactamase class C family)